MDRMAEDNMLYVAADKTNNYYRMLVDDHDKLLMKNINNEYKKSTENYVSKVNENDRILAEDLDIDTRVYAYSKRESFITIKDHKENYINNTKCRLINGAKSDMGKVSKKILSRLLTSLRKKLNLQKWINSASTIEWFKSLDDKESLTFLQFDIVEFYPNISEKLVKDALEFAKAHVDVTTEEANIIMKTKETLLFKDGKPWIKKGSKPFNVTMGSWDGAEIADLVGLFLLSKLADLNINAGLYRDDGLAALRMRPRQAELIKKKICRLFKDHGLDITANANLKSVNFLDVNFNLNTGLYRPYMKPNHTPTYVHRESNYPKSILQNIPLSINKRLSLISSNEGVFKSAIPPYQKALEKSDYDFKLKQAGAELSQAQCLAYQGQD